PPHRSPRPDGRGSPGPHPMSARPPAIVPPPGPPAPPRQRDGVGYWLGLPLRRPYQMAHNGHGVLPGPDTTWLRPMPHGLSGPDHPWVTGINPPTGRYVWHETVVYRSPRGPAEDSLPIDDFVVTKTGQFLAGRVALSVGQEELPVGPRRRMPHGINYI